jgi:hypothetical protein
MTQTMQTLAADTPLAATVARVAALDPYLIAEAGDLEPGWFRAADLPSVDGAQLGIGLAHAIADYPGAEARVAGAFFVGHYVWYLAAAAIGCYLAERRVPDLAPEQVALRYSSYTWEQDGATGTAERIDVRFLSGRFAALPGDLAADHARALILPDEAALRDWLRRRLEAHLEPLIEAIAARTRLGRRAQWNLAADACARLFLHAGEKLGAGERGRAEGLAFVKAAGSPLRNPATGYLTLEHLGHRETFCVRGGCCLYYRVAPGENCATCVLRPAAERNQGLLDYMARKYG